MTRVVKSQTHPHIEWIELYNDGIMHECAILKTDGQNNKLFFPVNNLDAIDKNRLAQILSDRNARTLELWDLMSQKTLNNGINALQYFHQLVKIYTPNGKVIDPKTGIAGTPTTGTVDIGIQTPPAPPTAS